MDAISSHADRLAAGLFDLARNVGIERGVDYSMRALFGFWLIASNDNAPPGMSWERLAHANETDAVATVHSALANAGVAPPAGTSTSGWGSSTKVVALIRSYAMAVASGDRRTFLLGTYDALQFLLDTSLRSGGQFSTPLDIVTLMARLTVPTGAPLQRHLRVLDPATGFGNSLMAFSTGEPTPELTGVEVIEEVADRARMRFKMADVPLSLTVGNAFDIVPGLTGFDVVVAQPPWGVTTTTSMVGPQPFVPSALRALKQSDLTWLFVARHVLAPGGRAAILLPSATLRRGKRQEIAHDDLIASNSVEAIISLPAGALLGTSVASCIWILRSPIAGTPPLDGTLLIDAESMFSQHPSRGRLPIDEQGIATLVDLLASWRQSGTTEAPDYVARAVRAHDLSDSRGLDPRNHLADPPAEAASEPSPPRELLTHLSISNLKSFGPTPAEVTLAPITLIFGANSAGKSTIIQSLLLLRQSLGSEALVTQGQDIDLGSFSSVVHRHSADVLTLAITYGAASHWVPPNGTADPSLLRCVTFRFEQGLGGRGLLKSLGLKFGDRASELPLIEHDGYPNSEFAMDRESLLDIFLGLAEGTLLYPFDSRKVAGGSERDQAGRLHSRLSNAKRAARLMENGGIDSVYVSRRGLLPVDGVTMRSPIAQSERDQNLVRSYVQRSARLVSGIATEVEALLTELTYLGPLRSAPKRFYNRTTGAARTSDGQHVAMFLFDNTSTLSEVNKWLQLLEIPYTVDVVPVQAAGGTDLIGDVVAISLTDRRSDVSVTPADVGFGISQVLPIVVDLLARQRSVICIEQPETHLHPRLQARLADLLVASTAEASQANQVIVETHSEHLLLRLQRRVRDGTLSAEDLCVLYVDQSETGVGTVRQLRVDEQGDLIDEWPEGFFDERLEEMFEGL